MSPPSNVLGLDPASTGAAVFLSSDRGTAVGILWESIFRKKQKVFKVTIADPSKLASETMLAPTLAHVGSIIANLEYLNEPFSLSCEDTYVSRNAYVAINLGKTTGMLLAPIMIKHNKLPNYVKANTWRQQVLGIKPRTKRDVCKKLSLQLIPSALPCISGLLTMLGKHDHLTDAAGIALWLHQKNNTTQE